MSLCHPMNRSAIHLAYASTPHEDHTQMKFVLMGRWMELRGPCVCRPPVMSAECAEASLGGTRFKV